ncbi:MFS transporter [Streptomyces sp. GS7]|uniref:MFS transporter n=1 Tax=Streptomyces sp. GS7 TaxID=2692234 RepID=UPI001317DCDD|nr:MFS transporter [Streptomyces sp. GS7]QHC21240.1 MFS transporter [Streptomyces sp. GS7]
MTFTPYTSPAPDAPAPKAGRREWLALAVLLLPCLLVSMDVSVLYFAVPFLTAQLEPSSVQQLWILDVYGFVLAGLLITMGALGDRIGRRRLLLTGAALFALASGLAAYARSAETLIAARALLGVGGATLMPSTLALIRNLFHDATQRGKAVAIWSVAVTGGIAIGPVLSGVLLEHFWWGSVFLVNTPAMALLLLCGPLLLPEFKNPATGRFDLLGSALSLAAMLPAVYGIKEIARNGVTAPPVAALVVGLLAALAFVRRQRTARHPMLDLELFRHRGFCGSILMNLLAMFAVVGCAVFFTQYLQSVRGMSPLEAALWNLVPTLAVGGVAPLSAALARRIDRAHVIALGFALATGGFIWLSWLEPASPLWLVLAGSAVYASGLVTVMSLGNELAIGIAPPERAGSASALLESGTELGGALGMAILGSIGGAVYRGDIGGALPTGLPARVADAARETLAGATAVAAHLPGRVGTALLTAARTAFTHGLHTAVLCAAAVMAAAAVLAVALLRGVRTPGTAHDGAAGETGETGDPAAADGAAGNGAGGAGEREGRPAATGTTAPAPTTTTGTPTRP